MRQTPEVHEWVCGGFVVKTKHREYRLAKDFLRFGQIGVAAIAHSDEESRYGARAEVYSLTLYLLA
jgi:hypothetical protein